MQREAGTRCAAAPLPVLACALLRPLLIPRSFSPDFLHNLKRWRPTARRCCRPTLGSRPQPFCGTPSSISCCCTNRCESHCCASRPCGRFAPAGTPRSAPPCRCWPLGPMCHSTSLPPLLRTCRACGCCASRDQVGECSSHSTACPKCTCRRRAPTNGVGTTCQGQHAAQRILINPGLQAPTRSSVETLQQSRPPGWRPCVPPVRACARCTCSGGSTCQRLWSPWLP